MPNRPSDAPVPNTDISSLSRRKTTHVERLTRTLSRAEIKNLLVISRTIEPYNFSDEDLALTQELGLVVGDDGLVFSQEELAASKIMEEGDEDEEISLSTLADEILALETVTEQNAYLKEILEKYPNLDRGALQLKIDDKIAFQNAPAKI